MPCYDTVQRMLGADEDFAREFKVAREIYYQRLADEMLDIADDGSNDYMERCKADGTNYKLLDKEHIWRSKVRLQARQWLLCRVLPKIYGAKQVDEGVAGKITGDIKAIIAEVASIARAGDKGEVLEAEVVTGANDLAKLPSE